jgi:hypothetical protein
LKAFWLSTALVATLCSLLFVARASAAPELNYGCTPDPSVAATPDKCAGWQTKPVTLKWAYDNLSAAPSSDPSSNCNDQTFSEDKPSIDVKCTVDSTDPMNPGSTSRTVHLQIDTTPPTVTSATPDRPPDSNGWYNHPVGFTFSGDDATSHLAFCTPVLFSGPGMQVTGSCQDNAGNVGTASFPVAFDAAPPSAPRLFAIAGNGKETVKWQISGDTVRVQLTRLPGPGNTASGAVYSGTGTSFVDNSVSNGVAYSYTLTAFDAAGNSSSDSVTGTPDPSAGLGPARGAVLGPKRILRWPLTAGADYYNVQVFRGSKKVLSRWPAKRVLRMPRKWTFQGKHHVLRPGRYRWYVWPGIGPQKNHDYGPMIGQSSFVVAPPAAPSP